jgi:ElaB/YqjD/DUF883 family membrane-anchored ribosome-binding protein
MGSIFEGRKKTRLEMENKERNGRRKNGSSETKMPLSKDQEDLYKKTMQEAKRQLEGVDALIEKELQKVRRRLAELQESKKSLK